jgi:hypothetical protein
MNRRIALLKSIDHLQRFFRQFSQELGSSIGTEATVHNGSRCVEEPLLNFGAIV